MLRLCQVKIGTLKRAIFRSLSTLRAAEGESIPRKLLMTMTGGLLVSITVYLHPLDWTTSPFVAAFFAFSEVGSDQTPYRAIYALHQPSIERMAKGVVAQENTRKQERKDELQKTNEQPGIIESSLLYSKA